MSTQNPTVHSRNFKDLTGLVFGELTVISYQPKNRVGKTISCWLCVCSCGKEKVIRGASMVHNRTISCGHVRLERIRLVNRTHGKNRTPEHRAWNAIKTRCYNKKVKSYADYGGRGVKVCQRWRDSFADFLEDMGERPSRDHSIDRIDNGGNYACGKCEECITDGLTETNCCWSDPITQANNKRNNVWLTFNGQTKTIPQWGRETGFGSETIRDRLNRSKWSVEKSLTTPVRKFNREK